VLVEPPGSDLPAPAALTRHLLEPVTLRVALAAAATAMAVSSRGNVIVLAAVLAVLAADPLAGAGGVAAAVAMALRWGSPSLGAIAGDQSVLGPAVTVGPALAAAGAALAAAALVLAARTPPESELEAIGVGNRPLLPRVRVWLLGGVPYGVAAAAAAAGPGPGGELWVRIGASVAAVLAAVGVAAITTRASTRLPAGIASLVAGVAAVACTVLS
jgi:hypothetical protein